MVQHIFNGSDAHFDAGIAFPQKFDGILLDHSILPPDGVNGVSMTGNAGFSQRSGVGGFDKLDQMFFPMQTLGFLFAGIAIVLMLSQKKRVHLAMEPMTLICIVGMVGGLGCLDVGLCILSKKMKKPALIVVFALSFVCCLGMGYLSSKDFDEASMNWIAEFVNFFGQGLFLLGVWMLHKAGLKDFNLGSKE